MAQDPPSPINPKIKPTKPDPLGKFPSAVREAHTRFLANGDVEALDLVVLSIIRDHQPEHVRATTPLVPADSARLMEDLGFDSLALAEIVFFIEDLYSISITNQELVNITNVGELRAFIRTKVAATEFSEKPRSP